MDSRSSSPDPLGQPDLSSPFDLRTPTRSGSRRKTRTPRKSELEHDPVSNLNLATPSPEPQSFHEYLQTPASEKRQLLSPWRPEPAVRAAQEEMDEDAGRQQLGGSPDNQYPNHVVTTSVPLKTGDETPRRRRKKRRPLTPKRRRSTPAAKRVQGVGEEQLEGEEIEVNAEPQLSPTPKKKGPGRPRIFPADTENSSNKVATSNFNFQPVEIAVAPGASPGKRRRVISDGDAGGSTRWFKQAARSEAATNGAIPHLAGQNFFPTTNTNRSPNKLFKVPSSAQPSRMDRSQDPTEQHEEFDSIVESEDFTMVSLSSIPSGQQLRSLTRGGPPPTEAAAPARSSPRRSPRSPRTQRQTSAAAPVSPRAARQALTQLQDQGVDSDSASIPSTGQEVVIESTQAPNTPYGNGLLAGFSPATRRELRAGLRLGQELARRSVQAKKAAAEVEDATGDLFAELAATESSNLSTSSNSSRMDRRAPASDQLLRPLGGPTVNRPEQLPSPEQSDEQEPVVDNASEMSWKFDTPGRNRLSMSQMRQGRRLQRTPPRKQRNASSDPDEAQAHSSPDKQLFLEQAAAEIESSRFHPNSEVAVELSSNESDSGDSSSDEEPPELSEATRSLLADATGDIWQSEAESSKISRVSRFERQEPQHQDPETNEADNSISQDSERAFVVEKKQEIGDDISDVEDEVKSESDDAELELDNSPRVLEAQSESRADEQPTRFEQDEMMEIDSEEVRDDIDRNERSEEEKEQDQDQEEEDEEEGEEDTEEGEEGKENGEDIRDEEETEEEDEEEEGDEEDEELEVDDEAETIHYMNRQTEPQQSAAEAPESSPRSSPPLKRVEKEPSEPQEKSIFDGELLPPKRGKLLSLWRRQSDEPIVYSDEPELPPAEDTMVLGKRQRTFVTPEARKKGRYDDADFSILSEFKGASTRADTQTDREPVSSPLKRVRFESEDPENPYLPTTPVLPSVPQIYEDPEEEEDETSREMESEEERSYQEQPARIRWDEKPATPPKQQGSWLSGWLPSWFKVPEEPVFKFSLPGLPQLRSAPQATATAPTITTTTATEPEAYRPRPPPPEFSHAHYAELKRLYHVAKERPFAVPHGSRARRVTRLLGWEICRLGWRKRVNTWELGIIAEFLRPANPLAAGVSPEQVARRLFSIWAVEVQRGNTGLGRATPGLFSTRFVADREKILARARRKKSMAAS